MELSTFGCIEKLYKRNFKLNNYILFTSKQ